MERLERRAPRLTRWVLVPALDLSGRVERDQIGVEAGSLTYGAFLSLPPLLLLALTVLEVWLSSSDAAARVVAAAEDLLPGLGELLKSGMQLSTSAAVGAGIVGIATLLWAASGFAARARQALGAILGTERTGLVAGRAVAGALGVPVLLLLTVYVGVATWLGGVSIAGAAGVAARGAAFAALLVAGCAVWTVVYRLMTPGAGPSLRGHLPGGVAFGVGFLLLERFGAVYVDHVVARSRALYGAVGALFGLFAFLYLAMWLFLLGAELTAARRDGTGWWAPPGPGALRPPAPGR
ncbi:MAG: YihY/virulence factor BrkB family protein [Planctomycetaceae bacterium]